MRVDLEKIKRKAVGSANGQPAQMRTSVRERVGAHVGYRTRTIGIGLVLALAAGALTLVYVNRAERRAALIAADAPVFVATRDIPAGTPGSAVLSRRLVAEQRVPRRSVVSGAIAEPEQIRGLLAAETIYAGEQITTRRFRPLAERGVQGDLTGTTRAIVISGDPTQLADGLLRTGDRVDVVAAITYRNSAGRDVPATRVILRELLVVRGPGNVTGGRQGRATVALALTDAQAQKLFFAMNNGRWWLLLRPVRPSADSTTRIETADSVLGVAR